MWEFIDQNWLYIAIGTVGYVVGSLHGKSQIKTEWMMSNSQQSQQMSYDDYFNNLRNAKKDEKDDWRDKDV